MELGSNKKSPLPDNNADCSFVRQEGDNSAKTTVKIARVCPTDYEILALRNGKYNHDFVLKNMNLATCGGVTGFWHAVASTNEQLDEGVSKQFLLVQMADMSLHYYNSGQETFTNHIWSRDEGLSAITQVEILEPQSVATDTFEYVKNWDQPVGIE